MALPVMIPVELAWPASADFDLDGALSAALDGTGWMAGLRAGDRIAIGVGSRGIDRLFEVVRGVVQRLQALGLDPFIVPAMGSHGGATAGGQSALLADYGITEARVGARLVDSMETRHLGASPAGEPIHFSAAAWEARGILVINRVKPHTDFQGTLGSGLTKMLVVGLGKVSGAAAFHRAASRLGYQPALEDLASGILKLAPVLGGLALIEDPRHRLFHLEAMPATVLPDGEKVLLEVARQAMPRLPVRDLDLLVVDRMGKNISGTGMDPNIIGRGVHGYVLPPYDNQAPGPRIRRLLVRDLTPESHGNAVGIGMADATTRRLVQAMDVNVTRINALTSMTPVSMKIPMAFDTDRQAIEALVGSLGLKDSREARILRIRDTLSLERMEVSPAVARELSESPEARFHGEGAQWVFGPDDNLKPIEGQ